MTILALSCKCHGPSWKPRSAPMTKRSPSSLWVAGLGGKLAETNWTRANPPCLGMSLIGGCGVSQSGNLNGSWVRGFVAGGYSVISARGSVRALVVWRFALVCQIEWKVVLWDSGRTPWIWDQYLSKNMKGLFENLEYGSNIFQRIRNGLLVIWNPYPSQT